jgi:hypothetical protein
MSEYSAVVQSGALVHRFGGWQAEWLATVIPMIDVTSVSSPAFETARVYPGRGLADITDAQLHKLLPAAKYNAFMAGDEDEFYSES